MSLVKLGKLNKAQALAALFNNAKTQGMGVLHYNPNHVMTEAEAEAALAEGSYVDYLEGRVIKIDFDKFGENQLDVTLYNRDNGPNAAQDALEIAEDEITIGLRCSRERVPCTSDKRIFGGAFLLADRAAADRAAADRAAARRTVVQELYENAKAILKRLNKNT